MAGLLRVILSSLHSSDCPKESVPETKSFVFENHSMRFKSAHVIIIVSKVLFDYCTFLVVFRLNGNYRLDAWILATFLIKRRATFFELFEERQMPQKHMLKATVPDSTLRVEMNGLEEQADNAKARDLY